MATPLKANWNYPTAIRFGAGRITELADACRAADMARPLLVTDTQLARHEMVARALGLCEARGLKAALFSDISSDPSEGCVAKGVAAFRAGGHDGVVAFGGGSSLDAGKAVAFAAGQRRPLWDFEDIGDNWTRADAAAIAPVVAVPTTAGTGSEVGRASVIKDTAARVKRIIFHPRMLPRIVIADPELTVGLPSHLTAAVGMDALSHNMEAFFAPTYHPFARGIAMEGIRLIQQWLPVAVREPANIEARSHMLAASEAGATAFQRGLGAMHALAHPLGAVYGKHHGLLNAILMPYVVAANAPAIADDATELARLLRLGESTAAVLDWIVGLRREIGIPENLSEIGITPNDISAIAEMAVQDPSATTNPIAFSVSDYAALLGSAITGTLSLKGRMS